jgi:hypothetical protein
MAVDVRWVRRHLEESAMRAGGQIVPSRKQATPAGQRRAQPKAPNRRELSRAEHLAKQMLKLTRDDDPAIAAGAVVIFAAENIKRSAKTLPEARGYLDATRVAIDGLLLNAFPPGAKKEDAPEQRG